MKLIDNVSTRLGEDLKENIHKGDKLSIAASSFSIYAFEELRKELGKIDELRFVFSSPTLIEEKFQKVSRQFYIPHIYKEEELCGGEFELRLRNKLNQRAIAKECSKWVSEKVTFKSNKHSNRPITGLIHVNKADNTDVAYANIDGFTTSDLGSTPKGGFPVLVQKNAYPNSEAFLEWFNQIWENQQDLVDVTEKVQSYFENAFKENSPEFIYFITLYNIFNDFLEDMSLDNLPDDQIGFKDTVVWDKLFNFQKDAVIGAINKLEKYGGCVLADSVGLGKTFSALGVIKYYEMRNKDVLVLCPKKLEANWNTFRHNDKDNILAADRFRFDVLFHTDMSRNSGTSNGRNLANVNWGNYGLIVIDESHNFRNNNAAEGKENRYQALMRKVVKEGIKTKVLMLSATPVNNRFNDLKNQLALAYEGEPEEMDKKLDTQIGIENIFRRAQRSFNEWSRYEPERRTTDVLLDMLDFDFFEILDSLTIARSRKHITTYYDTKDIGKFPDRNPPQSIRSKLTLDGSITYTEIAENLNFLNLSIYSPLHYVLDSKRQFYANLYDKDVRSGGGRLKQTDRESSLLILMRINLLKRLESSVDSFRITLEGILEQVESALKAIDDGVEHYKGTHIDIDDENLDWEPNLGDEGVFGKKIKVHVAHMDTVRWREDLVNDQEILTSLWNKVIDVRGDHDAKLQDLISLLLGKVDSPFNIDNKKAIIFTAFADTANYLYEQLQPLLKNRYGFHSALVTGSKKISSSSAIPKDLNTILTCFSPISKSKELLFPHIKDSIELLIGTDCISEGQNLQDCDFLINYDIHWNPVRIIQRFGRVDRIGSKNDSITMVNFWPDMELDSYINLKQRVESRMAITDMTATGDDNILDSNSRDLDYRKSQLKKLQTEVIDLEDLREGVSITDLGLNDFRIDLSNYIKEYGELKHIPEGLHAVVPSTPILEPGVAYVLKNVNTTVNIDKLNRLHPYYLVYLTNEGQVFLNHVESKKTLDAMRMLCKGVHEPIQELCAQLSKETDDYYDMSFYSKLLKKSISTILKTEEDKEVLSLFKTGGTTALQDKFKGIEDFKLISFLIIK
ncbi:SNF2 family DNA or RNA helicase [Roseivirga pacifica]|uniref:Superfamily II DNA or RNA helicase, SNF2 family n=1 Tax=Roseivirga pacifica TaxID=1267423 RepID=A0A1I0QHT8_9BACT|nr:helicase-related protein [Roseivirga pacifica]RKQ42901.1 SNF2 family DNA or RNA helicase [Roseivirga pacifica]SEW26654.1 Superfamily II DNA or RNA helicase, SNF2 family [Roseivirga pacifica]